MIIADPCLSDQTDAVPVTQSVVPPEADYSQLLIPKLSPKSLILDPSHEAVSGKIILDWCYSSGLSNSVELLSGDAVWNVQVTPGQRCLIRYNSSQKERLNPLIDRMKAEGAKIILLLAAEEWHAAPAYNHAINWLLGPESRRAAVIGALS